MNHVEIAPQVETAYASSQKQVDTGSTHRKKNQANNGRSMLLVAFEERQY